MAVVLQEIEKRGDPKLMFKRRDRTEKGARQVCMYNNNNNRNCSRQAARQARAEGNGKEGSNEMFVFSAGAKGQPEMITTHDHCDDD